MLISSVIFGVIHTLLGMVLIGLQVACQIIIDYYYADELFAGRFKPGAWLGSVIFIAGIIGIIHGCSDPRNVQRCRRLRITFIVFNIIVHTLSDIMVVLAVRWRWQMQDSEDFMFKDCEYPVASWIYYYSPHCEVVYHIRDMGYTMMIIACFESFFGFVGAIVVRQADSDRLRR